MREYDVKLFYDPERVKASFLKSVYGMFSMPVPSNEELQTPFYVDELGSGQAVACFRSGDKPRILKLTDIVMSMPSMRIEVKSFL
jgi:hypothetical protein